MSEAEFLDYIRSNSAETVLARMVQTPMLDRRAHAKAVMRLFKATVLVFRAEPGRPKLKDEDSVVVAVLATATLAELKALKLWKMPNRPRIDEVLRALQPDWIEEWVMSVIENSPHFIERIAPVWEAGLCPRPTSDAFILGYYGHGVSSSDDIDTEMFFTQDVWRFFEVEGGGEFSLAAHDKYAAPTNAWAHRLSQYAADGRLDRDRLLDASLDALQRDFGQFVAGWYSRFHMSLDPAPSELAARAERYLRLLRSAVPPTVSFAIRALQSLQTAKVIDPAMLLGGLEPALQVRAKGTALAALRLLAGAVRQDAYLRDRAAHLATCALISEDAGVQNKALDLIEKWGGAEDAQVRGAMAEYATHVAASVRPRIAEMSGVQMGQGDVIEQDDAPRDVAKLAPIDDKQSTLASFLAVLESPRDPFEVERAMDGIARFGAALLSNEIQVSPLKKRARQLCSNPGDSRVRAALAVTGRAFVEGRSCVAVLRDVNADRHGSILQSGSFARLLMDRNSEVLASVRAGYALPMLSLPSDMSGCVSANDLVDRLALYHACDVQPGARDLQLALLRLARVGRSDVLPRLKGRTEFERAVMYVLGADQVLGSDAALWAAAWAARQPTHADTNVMRLYQPALPDCGAPAENSLRVWREDLESGPYYWPRIEFSDEVAGDAATDEAIPSMFYPWRQYRHVGSTECGRVYEDVVWASLVRPSWQEPFFRQAILSMDTDQKLSDHYCLGFLEPFFRPGLSMGPLACATLAYYLASDDKSVAALTADAVAELASNETLDATRFADALKPFLLIGALPTRRWTKGLSRMAQAGAGGFARDVITHLLCFAPEDTPRDMGAMLELLFELQVATGTVMQNSQAVACLKGMPGGGKVAKFKKKLIETAA